MIVTDHLRTPFAVLAGAGISYAPPSSLPKAVDFLFEIVETLPITESDQKELLEATSSSWSEGIGLYHFLRFEQFIEALQLTVDEKLTILEAALPNTVPNQYHFLLARFIGDGCPVITTNFDTLIEDACQRLGVSCRVLASEDEYKSYFESQNKPEGILFKLHGTLRRNLPMDGINLNTTISDVTTQRITSPYKWAAIGKLLESFDLLVLGYSGSDDFDVMRAINYAGGGRRLCWINHKTLTPAVVFSGLENENSLLNHPEMRLAWFFNRMFLSFDYHLGNISRKPEDAIIIDGDTTDILLQTFSALGKSLPRIEVNEVTTTPKLNKQAVSIIINQNPPATMLLAGRLHQLIGRYEKACTLMHRALEEGKSHLNDMLMARAHLWISQMMHERMLNESARIHLKHALDYIYSISKLHWTDITTLAGLTILAGSDKWQIDTILASKVGRAGASDPRNNLEHIWLLGRQMIVSAQLQLYRKNFEAAQRAMQSLRDDDFRLDDELRGDILYWRAVLRSVQEDDDAGGQASNLAREASIIYEKVQCRSKWIDALILEAEQDLPFFADWAYASGYIAALVCDLIGNDGSASFARTLQAKAAEILNRLGQKDARGIPLESPTLLHRLAKEASERENSKSDWTCCPEPPWS